jgi:FkbM family methyltransferase
VTHSRDLEISYAQNFEDLVLLRCFKDVKKGFYVDVGAQDPVSDSVTNLFYLRGWTGINIEPSVQYFTRLETQRVHDINLNVAISDRDSNAKFFEVPGSGLSTLDSENAADLVKNQVPGIWRTIRTKTLNSVLFENSVPNDFEFLKIDVEGFEEAVLSGIDFEAYRPKIVLVEAVKPNSTTLNDQDWHEILLGANYFEVYFDGLNKYFLRRESANLQIFFNTPVGYFDKFIRYAEHVAINNLEVEKEKTKAEYEALSLALIQARNEFEVTLQAIHHSTIWRLTSAPRYLVTRARKVLRRNRNIAPVLAMLSKSLEHPAGKRFKEMISQSSIGTHLKRQPTFHRLYGKLPVKRNVFPQWVFSDLIEVNVTNEILKYQGIDESKVRRNSDDVLASTGLNLDVTVLTALYRSEEYLEPFLRNLQSQIGFTSCQVVLVSTDPNDLERALLDSFSLRHPHITLIYTRTPFGIYSAWNLGIKVANRKYLTNWNVDDARANTSLMEQFTFMESNQSVDIGYQDLYYVFDKNLSWETIVRTGIPTQFPNVSPHTLMSGACPPHNGPIWKRSIHEEVGLFNIEYKSAADLDFWIRCSLNGKKFLKMNSKHSSYFHNPKGMSTSRESPAIVEIRKILETHIGAYESQHLQARNDLSMALGMKLDSQLTTESFVDKFKDK